jgi:hypothetical protein
VGVAAHLVSTVVNKNARIIKIEEQPSAKEQGK